MKLKYLILTLYILFGISICDAQTAISVLSWNLKDLGVSKSAADIEMIARVIARYDVVAIQEVVAGSGGPKALSRLVNELNKDSRKWKYEISEVTSGTSAHKAERYAFLWQDARVLKSGKGWLEPHFESQIEREPFFARFTVNGKTLTLVNFHAITKFAHPETEVKYFRYLPELYPTDKLIFCGDFNLPESHTVFNPLKSMGYRSALVKQKTTLRQACLGTGCLASELDNFYYDALKVRLKAAGVIHFYRLFRDIKVARKISDHIPVFAVYQL
ncbi:endonuclease/exonuclease/phosphatase family protein [Pedobacter sp. 22226]|uniref:endonuclease/exonuclease/phosphatase family protein n=1 Tax=Pedobacter sp. 22226 TaxID=3453894 RepID=UPI003F85C4F7